MLICLQISIALLNHTAVQQKVKMRRNMDATVSIVQRKMQPYSLHGNTMYHMVMKFELSSCKENSRKRNANQLKPILCEKGNGENQGNISNPENGLTTVGSKMTNLENGVTSGGSKMTLDFIQYSSLVVKFQ